MAVKKKKPGFPSKPVSGKRRWTRATEVCIGCDVSMSSISIGVIALTADGKTRAGAHSVRWQKGTDYFDRMLDAARGADILHDALAVVKVQVEAADVYIAIEEAVSFGHIQRAKSAFMKQQIQISGAFMGGVLKWGWKNIFEIQANQWRKVVADDLGITTHKTKWSPNGESKFRAKEWIERFHPKWDGKWVDLINSKDGMIPRPETSKAKAVQSDDRYEALAMAEWMRRELKAHG